VGAQAQILWGDKYLSVTSAVLTILILVFSEIIPKTLGANFWPSLTRFTVVMLRVLMFILYPFVIVSQWITSIFNINKRKSVLSRADFSAMAEIAAEEGIFHEGESRIIQNIATFDKLKVSDIMTPRMVLFAEPETTKAADFYKANTELVFSRVPIFVDSVDNISGYILKDDLLTTMIEGKGSEPLKYIKRAILTVYENLAIPSLYNRMIEQKEHIALVVDEYGGTEGIVTLEDIIETILGLEITDETDNIEDLQKVAREKWEKRAKRMGLKI
jgi:CBS domain containing-hemolysin-like protein